MDGGQDRAYWHTWEDGSDRHSQYHMSDLCQSGCSLALTEHLLLRAPEASVLCRYEPTQHALLLETIELDHWFIFALILGKSKDAQVYLEASTDFLAGIDASSMAFIIPGAN